MPTPSSTPTARPPVCDPQLSLATTYEGVVSLHGCLDPIGGATVAEALRRIERDLRRSDLEAGIVRSAGHRRAAALVEMAVRANSAPAGGRRPEPLITVVAGAVEFERLCELSTGTVIHPGALLPHLARCDVQSIVFGSATHAVRASPQRSFTGLLRRVVQVRDRHCQHPSGCDEPIAVCDVDHVIPRRRGGPTDQRNGRLLCEPHNRHLQLRHPHGDPVGDFAPSTESPRIGGERSPPRPTS